MKQNLKHFTIILVMTNIPSIIIPSAAKSSATQSTMNHNQKAAQDEFDKILLDPIFLELKKLHAEFKTKKEELGTHAKKTNMPDLDFQKELKTLRDSFDKQQKEFLSHHKDYRRYSLLDSLKLIELFRALQKRQEEPLKQQYLFTKATYNRKEFERKRLEIGRIHEAVRTFIRMFTEEAKTEAEQELISDIKEALDEYKTNWYNLKNELLQTESFENEQRFQEAEALLALEFQTKIAQIHAMLQTKINNLVLMQDALEEIQQAENTITTITNIDQQQQSSSQAKLLTEQLPKKALLPKGGLRAHL